VIARTQTGLGRTLKRVSNLSEGESKSVCIDAA
jgi:hypothetical protein